MYKSWVKPPLWNLAGLISSEEVFSFHLKLAIAWAMPTSNERKMLSSNEALKELIQRFKGESLPYSCETLKATLS